MTEDQQELIEYFKYQCKKGFNKRFPDFSSWPAEKQKQYRDRLEYETKIVLDMGFAGYFLIVWDMVKYCLDNDIPVGLSRGSAASSIICYCLYITYLDPIEWHLPFERFLNPSRVSMPDIDQDISALHREQVVRYIESKYGVDCVLNIGTFGLMRAKNAIKNVARVLGHPYQVGDELSKLLLPPIHGKPQSLKTSIEKVPELKEHYNKQGAYGEILRIAERFEGLVNSVGVHAAGKIVAGQSLKNKIPAFLGKEGEPTAQWEMNSLEALGYVKFDILGLNTLSKIYLCIQEIESRYDIKINIHELNYKDKEVFKTFCSGNLESIFQFETSQGMKDLCVQVRPSELKDLAALVAIFRPGPLGSDGLSGYLEWRQHGVKPQYLIPELEPILSSTGGMLVFQEQAMKIATDLCGYTGPESDNLRKIIGKKLPEKMTIEEPKFKDGWVAQGHPREAVDILWSQLLDFASYSFNLSHAAAYGTTAYITAYFKTHYPAEWMLASMICDANNNDQMIKYISECRRMGLEVSPPDINRSQNTFSIDEKGRIVFGLSPIRNLGEGPVSSIIDERVARGKYKDLTDFLARTDLSKINKLKVESLVKSGCFDYTGKNRNSLLSFVEKYWDYKSSLKPYESKLVTYHKRKEKYLQRLKDIKEGKTKAKSLKEPELPERPQIPKVPSLPVLDIEDRLREEHHLLGFYIDEHPLDSYDLRGQIQIDRMKQLTDSGEITFACMVAGKQEITTKTKKQKMAFLTLEDQTGQIEGVAFAKVWSKYQKLFESGEPLYVYGYLEITQGETDNLAKIRIGKVQKLSSVARKLPRKKSSLQNLLVKSDKLQDTINWLKCSKDGTIEVRPVIELLSGNKVILSKVFKVDKEKLSATGVKVEQEMGKL